jgi:tetratricopeptide (TPR) repeat protein
METTAEKEADEAMARMKPDGYQYYRLGREYYANQRFAQGIRCLDRSIELLPNFAYSHFFRARCLANLDRDDEALQAYNTAIRIDPDYMHTYLMRAIFFGTSGTHGDPKKALQDLKQVEKLMPAKVSLTEKLVFMDMARAYSSVSEKLSVASEREECLRLAEVNLRRLFEMGFTADDVRRIEERDQYHMLSPLLRRASVKEFLAERERMESVASKLDE